MDLDLSDEDIIEYLKALSKRLSDIKSTFKITRLSRVDAGIIAAAFYYEYFLQGAELNSDPFSTIAYREEDSHSVQSDRFDQLIKRYITNDVLKYFGLNLLEFMELPTPYVEKILEVSGKCKAEVDRIAEKINKESERKISKSEEY